MQPELVSTLKRTAETIFNKGGIIRKIDNLGSKPLPYKMSANGQVYKTGVGIPRLFIYNLNFTINFSLQSYFVYKFDSPPNSLKNLYEECERDIDVIRQRIYKVQEDLVTHDCTLHDDLQPPAYRKEVQKMVAIGKKQQERAAKKKFQYNSGLDYYPFQK